MRCPNCNSEAVCTQNKYHYTECGLDNVFLEGIDVYECSCGEQFVAIPAMPELHGLIGLNLLKKKALLNSKEIKFLRKNMGLTATKLSKIIGVNNATISRWENNNQSIDKSNDRLIRFTYLNIKDIPTSEIKHLIEEDFTKIEPDKIDMSQYNIPWPKHGGECIASI